MTTERSVKPQQSQFPGDQPRTIPSLASAVRDAKVTRELMFTLRHFHLGDPTGKKKLQPAGGDLLPAQLDPFRDTSRLRYHYPLFLLPLDGESSGQAVEQLVQPLPQWLQDVTAAFAPGQDGARILKDHLPWLEHQTRQLLLEREGPVEAAATLAEVARHLQGHLNLSGDDRTRLEQDLSRLLASVPEQAQLLGYGRYAALHLLNHAICSQIIPRQRLFQEQIDACIKGLKELITVEWGKSDESIEPKMARDSVGPSGDRFDPAALSAVMDHSRGTREMSPERRERIERILTILSSYKPEPVLVSFVHIGTLSDRWLREQEGCQEIIDQDPCATAMELFDQEAAKLSSIFSAVRIARLEIDGIYDPAMHDPWFANFHWEAFSSDEILLVPCVVALGSADQVAGAGLRSLSRLLSSGRPVQILIRVQPHNNPGAAPDENPFQSFRTELGYLGIGHRQAVVTQSSAARHEHLMRGFLTALSATRTSLHIINTGIRDGQHLVPLNAWLVAGAAIESRAHPFFRINPEAGDSFAERMDFAGNPQWEKDWPTHPFRFRDENGNTVNSELAFTFADYCLLVERLRDHFRSIPAECDSEALTQVQDYLALDAEQADRRLPFVWAVDGGGMLHRLVISRELALACRDRRNYWRTLQEMAGIRNRHVELAIGETQIEERKRARAEREILEKEHAAEVEQVRSTAAGEAMQRLTDMLLGMELPAAGAQPFPVGDAAPPPSADEPAADSPQPSEAEPAAQEAPEEETFDEAWIDTPLCTSCNDCLKVNPLLFIYNEDKQALLGDLASATFAQLVEAAELCPAKCIHPGKPQNPNEADLDELIERAAPFNQ